MTPKMHSVPEGVFVLNPKNRGFIHGLTPAPVSENPLLLLVLKLAAAGLVIFFTCYGVYEIFDAIYTRNFDLSMVGLFTHITAGCGILFWLAKPILWPRRFPRGCRVVYGALISCKRLNYDRGASVWRLKYRFLSPSGRMLEGESSTEGTLIRIEDRSDPSTGVPVAIAYLNDKTHRML
jgi:hypothetical protein